VPERSRQTDSQGQADDQDARKRRHSRDTPNSHRYGQTGTRKGRGKERITNDRMAERATKDEHIAC